jgi:hypothetical protein
MQRTLDELLLERGTELKRLREHAKDRKGPWQKIHEKLVTLRAAKWITHFHGQPVTELVKPDDERDGGVDLAFNCGGTRYLLEHTTIESFQQQRRWTETGHMSVPLPEWDDLADCRADRVRAALKKKLPKLDESARREMAGTGERIVTVLVLECEDYWHSGPGLFLQALVAVLPEFRDQLPDQLQLVGTLYYVDVGMDPHEGGHPTADSVYVLDLASYRDGALKPMLIGDFKWFPVNPGEDPVEGGQWWDFP